MSDLYDKTSTSTSLEPRVAKLEVSLDRLTEDVRSLALVVRDQGATVEKQLTELTVAVTQAAGPRKTDWSLIISAVLLVMAIGSAAFWPLNQTVQENKIALETLNTTFQDHTKLELHPVGKALLQRLEVQLKEHIDSNKRDMENRLVDIREMHNVMEQNTSTQIGHIQKIHDLELSALKEKIKFQDERLYGRVVKLEDKTSLEVEREKDELQMWRLKAMGVSTSPPVNTHTHEVIEQK